MTDNSSSDDPAIRRGAAMFRTVFGEPYGSFLAGQLHEGAVGLNRVVMTEIAPTIWERNLLPIKIRHFVVIAALAALGRDDVKFFMRGGFAHGATREEIEEVLLLVGLEAGFPAATRAARSLIEAESEHDTFMRDYEARKGNRQ